MTFDVEAFLPSSVADALTDRRINDPDAPRRAARARRRRAVLAPDGRLNILAADHPARRVTDVQDDPLRMADRRDYLARVLRVLLSDAVDGIMATMDLLDDLLIVHELLDQAGGPRFLDDKLVLPSLNRGGLAGVVWEMDDPLTGPTPRACAEANMDGGKLLLRLCDDDPNSLRTLQMCADAITEMNAHGLPTFLEPLPVVQNDDGYRVVKEADALARIAGVAAALGEGSRHLWLKLPYCESYERVARATTLPILLLGGPAAGDPRPLLDQVASGMAAAGNVRGTLVGRNVLYPGGDDDPAAVTQAIHGIVHDGWDADRAARSFESYEGRDVATPTRWLTA